ncbi:DDE-type integrase/transposase/recombinase [Desulfogranum japonicum]|uniref:DDE-type integrase/transposase/recombinase n=1 Tax=Desulfogranum japonicum TaxID=231447 RepID=UPI0003FDA9E0|nr:DDE-type integrase/transposase/recombinase [Desulfogranum japonicum]
MISPDKTELAVWRYGIISRLLHRNDDDGTLDNELQQLASRPFRRPDGRSVSFSPETLRKWLYRYRHGGLPALGDMPKKNRGTHASVPEKLATRLRELRLEHPRWTVARMLNQLVEEKLWDTNTPSRATLYRFAGTRNLHRDPHVVRHSPAKPFAYQEFGQLWSADFMHGPKIRVQGNKRKTYLHAIIDDATRYVVRAGFFLAEDTEVMMKELMTAIRQHGIPLRFYTDNGACYASRHLRFVCANLGIHLIHTPPGKPRGRGKVERIFRTVRDGFLDGKKPPAHTLDGINEAFRKWLSLYHKQIHSSLGTTPLQKRLDSTSCCRELPEPIDIEPLFRMKRRCRVYLNNTIRFKKRSFEVPDVLPGERVDVWFMPWEPGAIWYGPEMKPAKQADPIKNAQNYRR